MVLNLLHVFLLFLPFVFGEISTGFIHSSHGFQFIAKFCFGSSQGGKITARIAPIWAEINRNPNDLVLLIYDDETSKFNNLNNQLTMEQKIKEATMQIPIHFHPAFYLESLVHPTTKPTFRYIVIASKSGHPIKSLVYSIRMTNMDGWWNREFGTNQQGLNTFYLCSCLVLTLIVTFYSFFLYIKTENTSCISECVGSFPSASALHRACFGGLFLLLISSFLQTFHFLLWTETGMGVPIFSYLADMLAILAKMCLLFLLLLVGNGFCVTNIRMESIPRLQIIAITGVIGLLQVVFFFETISNSSFINSYISWTGYILMYSYISASFWLLLRTLRSSDRKIILKIITPCFWWFFTCLFCVLVSTHVKIYEEEFWSICIQFWFDVVGFIVLAIASWGKDHREPGYESLTTDDSTEEDFDSEML